MIVLLGRILFSAIFIIASISHFSESTVQYATNHGVMMPSILVPLSGVMALLGGLSILVGYRARYGAWLLILFLIPVTLTMHQFWGLSDPVMISLQQVMFLKNLSLLGGALIIAHFGSGPFSLHR
jgi:putative oxidoreductase